MLMGLKPSFRMLFVTLMHWLQDLMHLDVLKVGEGNNEQALVDLQLSLAAYTQVVVKNLGDSIPKLVYAQLVGKVCTFR